jgi:glycosyltransferase involved in cell wall biosynthesis
MISVLILTYNEEFCIENCLKSVAWSDDIKILDSYSTDKTELLCKKFDNVSFHKRVFDDFSSQRNYGLHNLDFKYKWVFIIDADESCTNELQYEICQSIKGVPDAVTAFYLRRKLIYKDKWVRHNYTYPCWVGRLVNPNKVEFQGTIHEELIPNGEKRYLEGNLIHYPFAKGMKHWFSRRKNYAALMAEKELKNLIIMDLGELLNKDPDLRRKYFNALYRKIPFRWVIFFIYNFFIKLCFLDGIKGIEYILLETYYEYYSSKQLVLSRNKK